MKALLTSPYHEERFLGMLLLIDRHKRGSGAEQVRLARCYLRVRRYMNNWDLVDTSAHVLLGPHLDDLGDGLLARLAKGRSVWDRRIAVIATLHEIRQGKFDRALRVAKLLLHDKHDLSHKAVGWMLREIGEKDASVLRRFLDEHATNMPRTMLRYAIEKLPERERRGYLAQHS